VHQLPGSSNFPRCSDSARFHARQPLATRFAIATSASRGRYSRDNAQQSTFCPVQAQMGLRSLSVGLLHSPPRFFELFPASFDILLDFLRVYFDLQPVPARGAANVLHCVPVKKPTYDQKRTQRQKHHIHDSLHVRFLQFRSACAVEFAAPARLIPYTFSDGLVQSKYSLRSPTASSCRADRAGYCNYARRNKVSEITEHSGPI
jgi:hypothetical protein